MANKASAFGLGLFIVIALVILGAGVFLIGDKEFMFNATYRLSAKFPNASGLHKGAEVRVGGLRAGTIKQLELPESPDRKVTVVMTMGNATKAILRKDAVAAIKTEGILGDKYVEISLGSQAAPLVEDGDAIHGEPTVDVADVANSVALQVKSALASVQEDMEALKQNFLLRGFFNRRGYEDSGDLTKHAIARLPARPPMKEFSYKADDIFDKPEGVKLKSQSALDQAGQFLTMNPFGMAVVVVSAGLVGDTDKERTLTQAQAMGIRDYLVQHFALDDTRLKTMGLGKAKSADGSGKVQILAFPGGALVPSSKSVAHGSDNHDGQR